MNKNYECPIIEIIEFIDYINTFSNNGDIITHGQVQESSGGWLPWL